MPLSTVTFKPARLDITIYAGADYRAAYRFSVNSETMDLTGITPDAELLIGDVHVPLTSTVGPGNTIHISLSRDFTRLLEPGSTGIWDLYLKEDATDTAMPYLGGKVVIKQTASVVE